MSLFKNSILCFPPLKGFFLKRTVPTIVVTRIQFVLFFTMSEACVCVFVNMCVYGCMCVCEYVYMCMFVNMCVCT